MRLSIRHNLLQDHTNMLLLSLILHDLTSPSLPTCTSIMRAKGRKDLGMFSFLIIKNNTIVSFDQYNNIIKNNTIQYNIRNTISVIMTFLWNMKYITVAIVATANRNTVSMGKIVFALTYKVILENSAFPEN